MNLTYLSLGAMSESMFDDHIMQLAGSLPKLQVWSTYACVLTDDIWDDVASLRSLRRLNLRALTGFTVDGILEFIEKLGAGNKGLVIYEMHMAKKHSRKDRDLIQDMMAKKVQGKFKFY